MAYDVFISYRRRGGYETAKHLYDLLIRDGYNVSFDLDTLRNGDFDTQLLTRIDECTDFILILSKGAFDRSIDPTFDRNKDWMRIEIAEALKKGKNIIPIMLPGFDNYPDNLPEDIIEVSRKNGPKHSMEYFDEFYRKLKKNFMQTLPASMKATPPPIFANTNINVEDSQKDIRSEIIQEENSNSSSKNSLWGCLGGIVGFVAIIWVCCGAADFWEYLKDEVNKDFNTENYNKESLWKVWNEYLTEISGGEMFATIGEMLLNQSQQEFIQYSYDTYIDGKIEPSKEFHIWDMKLLNNDSVTIKYKPPFDIKPFVTDRFFKIYNQLKYSNYNNSDYWNPIEDLRNNNEITITKVSVTDNGKDGNVVYFFPNIASVNDNINIEMKRENGKWKINDFRRHDDMFTDEINHYIKIHEPTDSIKNN